MKKGIGRQGETIAAEYLMKKGYRVLHRNWYYEKKELDIVVTDDRFLVVVEVKTRAGELLENPEDLITKRKIHFLIEAADAYIKRFDIDIEVRFDLIIVLLGMGTPAIEHIERAFFPTIS